MPLPPPNPLCARLDIPAPRVEDAAAWEKPPSLSELLILALLEHGDAMTIEEIEARVRGAGFGGDREDLRTVLLKAWHGRGPARRGRDGRFRLVENSWEMEYFVMVRMKPREKRAAPAAEQAPGPEIPGEDVRLTREEVEAMSRHPGAWRISEARIVAAVIDAEGRAVGVEELAGLLPDWFDRRCLGPEFLKCRPCAYLRWTAGGRLEFDAEAQHGRAMRRAARAAAYEVLRREAEKRRVDASMASWRAREAVDELRHAREAMDDRPAIVRAVPGALGILDVRARTFVCAIGREEVARAASELGRFNSLLGVDIEETLHALGVDSAGRRLVDLGPPQKTRRVSARRVLTLTTEMLMRGTLGTRWPLNPATHYRTPPASADAGTARAMLKEDLRNLHSYHRYGVLHHGVLLRSGFKDEYLPVGWGLPGERGLASLLEDARKRGVEVEMVLDGPPDWERPWAAARRFGIEEVRYWEFLVRTPEGIRVLDRRRVFEARIAGSPEA